MGTGGSFCKDKSKGVKLTTHFQLVPLSRKRGFIQPLRHTSSSSSAELVKHKDNLPYVYLFTESHQPHFDPMLTQSLADVSGIFLGVKRGRFVWKFVRRLSKKGGASNFRKFIDLQSLSQG